MDYTFFMLPLKVLENAESGSGDDGNFITYSGKKIYRLHIIGTIAALETNEESGSGYFVIDDTFSTILVHFQRPFFHLFSDITRGNMVEVLGTIDLFKDSLTLGLNNIKKVSLSRYSYNKLESIKNMIELSK
jgi:RPA family protein